MSLLKRKERNVLNWFGHTEKMAEDRVIERAYQASVEGNKERGRHQRSWRDERRD